MVGLTFLQLDLHHPTKPCKTEIETAQKNDDLLAEPEIPPPTPRPALTLNTPA